jgi:medium-chain acyl-[acyl-carrier-protein] hydrolase
MMRALRREDLPLPRIFIASAARAPQFRRNYRPLKDPSREDLIDQVRRLEGLPNDVLANPELLDLLAPILVADTALYRCYVYRPEQPFDIPFVAVGGSNDPNVERAHLEAWQEQTTSRFACKQIEGSHFYLRSNASEFLETLRWAAAEHDRE